jgi:hypothetical protein
MQTKSDAELLREPSSDWKAVRPVLDEALAGLGREDREALLVRFLKNESLASVGAMLGVSEDAAQKRVSRALGKLREFLAGRGIHTTVGALAATLTTNAIEAAPADFAASLATGAVAKAAAAGNAAGPILKLLTFQSMKTAILILVLAGGLAALTVTQVKAQRRLRESQALVQRQADELQALRALNQSLASQTNELEQLRADRRELPKLRGEVVRMRQEQAAREAAATPGQAEASAAPEAAGPPILITAKFISVPAESLQTVAQFRERASGPANATMLMDDSEIRTMFHTLTNLDGMETLGAPQIQTLNGIEAAVSTTEPVPFDGTNVDVGRTLKLNPHYGTNSDDITLDLSAKITLIVDISPRQDESMRDLRVTTITNSVSVLDGQSVLLRQDIPGEARASGSTNLAAGPKTLLLVLTPHILRADGTYTRLERIVKKGNAGAY